MSTGYTKHCEQPGCTNAATTCVHDIETGTLDLWLCDEHTKQWVPDSKWWAATVIEVDEIEPGGGTQP